MLTTVAALAAAGLPAGPPQPQAAPAADEWMRLLGSVPLDPALRRGGDAGYMIILQVADAEAERARAEGLGVRVVDDIDRPDYRCAHFHPADFGGVLVSFDQQRTTSDIHEPYGDWFPAGQDWRGHRTDTVQDITAVELSTADPAGLARRWAELIARPLDPANPLCLPLDKGEIRFVQGAPDAPTSIAVIELKVANPAAAWPAGPIGGVEFRAVR